MGKAERGMQLYRNHTCERLSPGRYRAIREVKLGGVTEVKTLECNNPAWASRQLDEWEHQLMVQHQEDNKAQVAA